jgi:hypothetical protein
MGVERRGRSGTLDPLRGPAYYEVWKMQQRTRWVVLGLAIATGFAISPALARQSVVKNGSMEIGPGPGGPDPRVPLDWTREGGPATVITRSGQDNYPNTGEGFALKMYNGAPGPLEMYQEVGVIPGDAVRISAYMKTLSTDAINGATARIVLSFYTAADSLISSQDVIGLQTGSTPDVWTLVQLGPVNAPAGAAKARFTARWTGDTATGSAFWDAVSLTVNNGPNLLLNPDFELEGSSEDNPAGITHWLAFQFGRKSEDVSLDGDFSLKVQNSATDGDYCGLYQDTVDVTSGDRLFASAYIYNPLVDGLSGTAQAAIKLEFLPQSGTSLPPPEEVFSFDQTAPVNEWVPVTHTTVVPPGATAARIVIIANDTDTANGPVYFDDAFAERSSFPGQNQLLNPSMESGIGGINGIDNWTEFRSPACQARKNSTDLGPAPSGARTGNFVCRIQGSCIAGVYQDIDVEEGETLTVTTYAKQRSDAPYATAAGTTAGIKIEWRNRGLPPQIDIGSDENTATALNAPPGQWKNVFIDYTMPPASGANLRATCIGARNGVTLSITYFDNFETVIMNRFNGADADADNDQDMHDFALLQTCFNGSGGGRGFPCIVFDSENDLGDGDIDNADADYFFPRITGPANP